MRTLTILTLCAATTIACSRGDSSKKSDVVPPDQAADLLINRNWLDVWPQSKDERLHVYRFTPAMGGGVYQDRTLFRGNFELFTFEVDGDHVRIHLPDEDIRVNARYRIRRVDGPEPFDLELTLDPSPRGPARYFGLTSESSASFGLSGAMPPTPGK
jgi:hypothetical protein